MEQIRARVASRRSVESAPAADEESGRAAADEESGRAAAMLLPSESFDFDGNSIYRSSRGGVGRVLYGIRRLLRPLTKFVFNIDPMVHALAMQARMNAQRAAFDDDVARRLDAREDQDVLSRQAVQKLMAEMELLSAEMKNQRLLVESMAERLDTLERARACENTAGPQDGRQADEPAGDAAPSPAPPAVDTPPDR